MTAKGLGKGLSALISERPVEEREDAPGHGGASGGRGILPVEKLHSGKFQPRTQFRETELAELADSIRKNGIVQPVIVRADGTGKDSYEIIAGERRWRAAKMAGLAAIPATVMELDDRQAMEIALVENVQRQNLSPLEEAQGYRRLLEEFSYTQEQLAATIGKSRGQISNTLRLLELSEPVKELLREEKISAGHARALIGLERAEEIADLVVKRDLNVRQTERLARKINAGGGPLYRKKIAADPDMIQLQNDLAEKLGLNISIVHNDGRGRVVISYDSLEELDHILRCLEK